MTAKTSLSTIIKSLVLGKLPHEIILSRKDLPSSVSRGARPGVSFHCLSCLSHHTAAHQGDLGCKPCLSEEPNVDGKEAKTPKRSVLYAYKMERGQTCRKKPYYRITLYIERASQEVVAHVFWGNSPFGSSQLGQRLSLSVCIVQ